MTGLVLPSMMFAGFLAAVLYIPAGQQSSPAPKQCAGDAEFRQFDFWVGEWDVFGPHGRKAGTNQITSVESGCALLERWSGSGGVTGTSLTFYDKSDGRWHQAWMDGSGNALRLAGGCRDSAMVLESAPGGGRQERVSWTPTEDGRVRQVWESSRDAGRTWAVVFEGTYVQRKR